MNTHQAYTLASRPQKSRLLSAWAVLSSGTFSGAIFLIDVAFIVAMACFTGIAYYLVVYGDPGNVSSFIRVGGLAASIFAISNIFRGEYRLPNFFSCKPHERDNIIARVIGSWRAEIRHRHGAHLIIDRRIDKRPAQRRRY